MSQNEYVDGAKIAADIINKMSGKHKDRIVKAIQARNPSVANKIHEKLYNFESIAELNSQSIQLLMKEIDEHDLILSLKKFRTLLSEKILANLSERRRAMIEDELASLPPTRATEIEEAKRRILTTLEELQDKGLIEVR